MKILSTNDIHQMGSKWKELVYVCQNEKFDIVAIAGDLFPKDVSITGQFPFMQHIKKYAKQINETGAEIVLTLGNDDNQNLVALFKEANKDGLWHYLENSVTNVKGVEFAGMPYVPDYPFGYKYWCRGEFSDALRIDPQQFGNPVLIDKDNQFKFIPNYENYLVSKEKIFDMLEGLLPKVENMKNCIWLIHAPPSQMDLDLCSHGARVGSDAVLRFIEQHQPWITVHGHIHESPEYNGHKWMAKCGETTCIQGGQVGYDLHYTTIEIENGEFKLKHSIYTEKNDQL